MSGILRGEDGDDVGAATPLILVTNDDGYDAPGLLALAHGLRAIGEVWVVAPERQRSGVSRMITLHKPLRIRRFQQDFPWYWCSGTPTDCVYVALNHVLPRKPDLVVSGINQGANLGGDVMVSGTVAAAMEATAAGIAAVATSLASYTESDFSAAVALTVRLCRDVLQRGLPPGTLLNLNTPSGADPEQALMVTRLGHRGYEPVVHRREDPRGGEYFWIGGAPLPLDDEPGTDCRATYDGLASVTPVQLDLNATRLREELSSWPFAQKSVKGR